MIFAIFHIAAFIFTIVVDHNANDTSFLFKMLKFVPFSKYATLLGLLLLVGDFTWSWIVAKDSEAEKESLRHELNVLKAKLFDLQESSRK
jgi:hypothetical protein